MTIEEVLAQVDELKPNQYDDGIKVSWLSKLDEKIFKELISIYEDSEIKTFDGYTISDMGKELLVDEAYADLYIDYIFAMIDYVNQELDRYNNSMMMHNEKFNQYKDFYNRTHRRKKSQYKFG